MIPQKELQAGFTLVELLVCVGIIGILAASAINAMTIYREQAYDAGLQQTFVQVRTAFEGREVDGVAPNAFRRSMQYFNAATWSNSGVSSHLELIPGMPINVPDHIYVYARESNCLTAGCNTDYIFAASCKTGTTMTYLAYKDSHQVLQEYYNAGYDALC